MQDTPLVEVAHHPAAEAPPPRTDGPDRPPRLIAVVLRHRAHIPGLYMEKSVDAILSACPELIYRPIRLDTPDGRRRFLDLCVTHLGKAAVFAQRRILPIPSLYLNGRLIFDRIPDADELAAATGETA